MEKFEFSMEVFGLDHTADDFETRIFDVGCDDAVASFQSGRVIIDFARQAKTFEAAVSSAAEDLRSAGAAQVIAFEFPETALRVFGA